MALLNMAMMNIFTPISMVIYGIALTPLMEMV